MKRHLAMLLGTLCAAALSSPLGAQEVVMMPEPHAPMGAPPPAYAEPFVPYEPWQQAGPVCANPGYQAPHNCQQPGYHKDLCGFYVGASAVIVKPFWSSNPAFNLVTTPAAVGGLAVSPTTNRVTEFDFGTTTSPQVYVGWESECGFGIRGTWWYFNQSNTVNLVNSAPSATGTVASVGVFSAAPFGLGVGRTLFAGDVDPVTGNPTADTYTFGAALRLNSVDIDLTQRVQLGPWNLMLLGGVRYAEITQRYSALLSGGAGIIGGAAFTSDLRYSHRFSGVGPTIGLEAYRPLGETGLALYGKGRGGVLFGSHREGSRLTTSTAAGITGDTESNANRDSVVPVGTVEIGVEWSCCWGHFQPFLSAGCQGQIWGNMGNSSGNATFPIGNLVGTGGVAPSNLDSLGFLGVVATAGFRF